jgi:hypothetical protein
MFDSDEKLTQFCEKHPEYHIVTVLDADACQIQIDQLVAVQSRLGFSGPTG